VRSILIVLLAAAPLFAGAEPPELKLAAWYAPLFKEGASWSYRVTQTNEWDQEAAKDAGRVDAKGKVDVNERFPYDATCTASKLTRFKGGLAVELACSYDKKRMAKLAGPRLIGPPIDGVYLATRRGLYQCGKLPIDEKGFAEAVRGRPMLPARPARWSYRKQDGDRLVEKSLKPKRIAVLGKTRQVWCAYEHTHEGDGCDSTFCFAEGIGIASSQARSIAALMNSSDAVVVKAPPPD
jgi:hypothetical protein